MSSVRSIIKSIIPPLSWESYKGQAGRIGVVGGSENYTGAPYYAGISALRVGCDLVHVFCYPNAATVIKSYSPELIVHPILGPLFTGDSFRLWLQRLHSVVIGPGLGREPTLLNPMADMIQAAKAQDIPIIFDADGLYYLEQHWHLIRGYTKAILTPNIVEFSRLVEWVSGHPTPTLENVHDKAMSLAAALGNVTLVCKGHKDVITNGVEIIMCEEPGSPRRCGGQGDLLSGSLGTFAHWAEQMGNSSQLPDRMTGSMAAALAACCLTRECNRLAFAEHGRSMLTSNMVESIPKAFKNLFD